MQWTEAQDKGAFFAEGPQHPHGVAVIAHRAGGDAFAVGLQPLAFLAVADEGFVKGKEAMLFTGVFSFHGKKFLG